MNAYATCVRCHRPLKDAVSVARGMGAVCAGAVSRQDSGSLLGDTPVLNGVGTLDEVGLVCRRMADGRLACNVPHDVVHHSPTGFDCGYGGSGPAELALNVLNALLSCRDGIDGDAWRLHQRFKWDFITPMDKDGGHVPIEDINAWIATKFIEAERDAQ